MSTAVVFPNMLPSELTDHALQNNAAKIKRYDRYQTIYIVGATGVGMLAATAIKVAGVTALCFVALSLILLAFVPRFSHWINARQQEHIQQKENLRSLSVNQKIVEGLEPIIQRSSTLQKLSSVYTSPPATGHSLSEQGNSLLAAAVQIARINLTSPPPIPSYTAETLQSEVEELNTWVSTWDQRSHKKDVASVFVRSSLKHIQPHESDPQAVAKNCHLFMLAFSDFQRKAEEERKKLFPATNG